MNVQVLHQVVLGKGVQLRQDDMLYFAQVFRDTADEGSPRSAVGTVHPARVLAARIPFLALQDPLQRLIHDPPARVDLRYEAIGPVCRTFMTLDASRSRTPGPCATLTVSLSSVLSARLRTHSVVRTLLARIFC